MKKIIFYMFLSLCLGFIEVKAQFYGSRTYDYICIQQHPSWCTFSCLVIYTKGEYLHAGMKSDYVFRKYNLAVNCAEVTEGLIGYEECMSKISVLEFISYARFLLNKHFATYVELPGLFPPDAPGKFYKFPYFAINVEDEHMVLVIGVNVDKADVGYNHYVTYIDPGSASIQSVYNQNYPLIVLLENI